MNHDHVTDYVQETAALYALGALCQNDARAFEEHLNEGCPVCSSELNQFDRAVAELGRASEEVSPAGYVRDLLVARIDREQQQSGGRVLPFPEQKPLAEKHVSPKPVRSGINYLPWAVAASVAVFALVSFLAWRQASRQNAVLQNQLASAVSEKDEMKQEIARIGGRADELVQVIGVMNSPNPRVIQLAGQEPAPSSSGKIYWDVVQNKWVVSADLPPAPAGKTYQLWFVTTDQAKISAGLIKPDKTGHGFTVVAVPPNMGQLAAAAITLEPEGGSAQPTMPIYALGKAA